MADKYGSVDNIPAEERLNHGWYFTCDTCGAEIDDIKDFHVNNRGYCCKKCFNEWVESGIKTATGCKIYCNCCKKRNSSKPFEKVKEMKE